MKKLSKILALVLVLVMMITTLPIITLPASAANIPGGTKLYLVPSANWNQSNARFAAYFFGDGEAWVSMTKVAGQSNLYEVTSPAGKNFTNVIFCRMNPSASANNWNNKWNQTSDLTYNGTSNCYTVKEGTWDKGGGTWSTYGSACSHANVGAAATCTTAQVCLDCGDPVVDALGHTYNSAHLCTRCNCQATFTVAGSGAHLGTEWDTGNVANDMTYADGTYTKVYTNVAAGSYLLKVVRDHDWGTAYPSADKAYTVATSGSTVTVTLKGTAVTVTVEVPHVCSFSEPTCTEPGKCSCGETQGEALGHTWADATFEAPKTCLTCGAIEGEAIPAEAIPAEAQIGDVKYASLQEALNVGGEVVLLADIGLTDNKGLSVPAGVVVVLDLNGHVLGSNAAEAATSAVLVNRGSLTIKDSVGGGKITTAAVNPDLQSIPGYASNTITNYGVLVLESGTIENTTNAGAAYAVDNSSNGVSATFTMNGGKLEAVRGALRMFCNSAVYENNVTINGGEIVGGTRAIWIHLPGSDSTKAAKGNLTINGGTLNGGSGQSLYVYTYGNNHSETFVTITGGTFLNDVMFGGGDYKETQETVSITGGTFNGYLGRWLANDGWENITGDEGYHLVEGVVGAHAFADATCTAPKTCVCGATEGEALGHTWVDATCTAPKTCSECDATEGEALGHVDAAPCDHECDVCGLCLTDCVDDDKNHNCDVCGDVMSKCTDDDKNHFCDICGVQNSHCIDIPPYDHNCDWCGEKMSDHNFVEGKCDVCGEEDPNYVPPCAHKDTGLDAKCDVCGEYFLPTSPFKLEMYQASKGETYYFTGSMSGYYFAASNDITKAVDLYAEEVEGGYNVYFMSGSTKNYLYIELSGTHINAKFGTTKAVWYVDATYGCLTTEVDGAKYFLGTYSNYTTFGGTAYSRLTASTADVSQYVGRGVSLADHECTNTTSTVTAPTCTAQGYTTYKCADCGLSTKGDYVDALGHTAGAEATCTTAQTCTVCGTELVAALGHNHSAVVTAPTCTEAGYTTYTCACGDTYTGDEVAALGHTEEVVAGKDATCTEAGLTEGKKCSVCGETLVAQEEIPATGHTYVEGKCECGAEDPDYVEPSDPTEPTDPVEPTGFAKIWAAILAFFAKFAEMFKGLFAKG